MRGLYLSLAALIALAGAIRPAEAQVAANQLCSAAGYGAGCIGAFRPSGVPRGGGGGMGGMGNAFGGMMMSIGIGLLMDAMTNAMDEAAEAEQAAQQQQQQAQQAQSRAMAERAWQRELHRLRRASAASPSRAAA